MLDTVSRSFFQVYKRLGRAYLRPLLVHEWKQSLTSAAGTNERPVEYAFALAALGRSGARTVLDVGTGVSAWPHLMTTCGYGVTAVDKISEYWRRSYFNRHFHVISDDIVDSRIEDRFDAVTCLSVLEHIPDHVAAVRGMVERLRPGGQLVLTVPFNRDTYFENVYDHPEAGYGQDASYICRVYSGSELARWIEVTGTSLVEEAYYEVFTGEYWTMGERLRPPRRSAADARHHLGCFVLQAGPGG